jgi:hypothetical protein
MPADSMTQVLENQSEAKDPEPAGVDDQNVPSATDAIPWGSVLSTRRPFAVARADAIVLSGRFLRRIPDNRPVILEETTCTNHRQLS